MRLGWFMYISCADLKMGVGGLDPSLKMTKPWVSWLYWSGSPEKLKKCQASMLGHHLPASPPARFLLYLDHLSSSTKKKPTRKQQKNCCQSWALFETTLWIHACISRDHRLEFPNKEDGRVDPDENAAEWGILSVSSLFDNKVPVYIVNPVYNPSLDLPWKTLEIRG